MGRGGGGVGEGEGGRGRGEAKNLDIRVYTPSVLFAMLRKEKFQSWTV